MPFPQGTKVPCELFMVRVCRFKNRRSKLVCKHSLITFWFQLLVRDAWDRREGAVFTTFKW